MSQHQWSRRSRFALLLACAGVIALGTAGRASAQYPDPPDQPIPAPQPETPPKPGAGGPGAAPPGAAPPAAAPESGPPDGTPRAPRAGPATADLPYHERVRQEVPQTPGQRAKVLANLYALLSTATDAASAGEIAATIEGLWRMSYSDTVGVLMERALKAQSESKMEFAAKMLDAVVELAPDYAEGWHRRAVLAYAQNDTARALGDLRRALALDPNHYRALEGLAQVLKEVGQKKGALEAYRRIETIHPFLAGADEQLRELQRDVEGQGI